MILKNISITDADKGGYDSYYELCLLLMRKGGIIAFDNTLWDGKVVRYFKDFIKRRLFGFYSEEYLLPSISNHLNSLCTLITVSLEL